MSGPPKALLLIGSSGTGITLTSVPSGEITWIPVFFVAAEPAGGVEVPLYVDAHAVGATCLAEVVEDAPVADRTVRLQVEHMDPARVARRRKRVGDVELGVIGRHLDAVGPLDLGAREQTRQRPRRGRCGTPRCPRDP